MKINNPTAKILTHEQGTPEWLEARKGKITGTLAGKLSNGGNQTAYNQFMGNQGAIPQHHADRGHAGEIQMRDYCIACGLPIVQGEQPTITDGVYLASLDGISQDGTTIYEFKCPQSAESKTYTLAQDGKVPAEYMAQMQLCMGVSGATMAIYNVGIMDEQDGMIDYDSMVQIEVPFCPTAWQNIQANAQEFLQRVEQGEWADDAGTPELPVWHEATAGEYADVSEEIKELQNRLKPLAKQLKELGVHKANGVNVIKSNGRTTIDWQGIATELSNHLPNGDELLKSITTRYTTKGNDTISVRLYNDG